MLKIIIILLFSVPLISADFNLHDLCSFPTCIWKGEGIYFADTDINIETLIFDRIQNSVLSLRHLPNIKNVFVEHDSSFDKLVMCQHIVGNTQRINLRIGERQSFCEVVSSW